ncbi:MAG: DciA family protein [Rhodobacteraceae bacterium]|nr:DciA family protein [Paracoccaceae bacterium]MCY4196249.1 DciA family protein [Paracoccaceae bacterium]MCY4326004.1 DciA family protein [Paracoccaceae bacterium]
MKTSKKDHKRRVAKGFIHAGELIRKHFTHESDRKRIAATLMMSSWEEVAGTDIAAISEPIDLAFDTKTQLVTLTLLATGAFAEQVRLSAPYILRRVNSTYGYKAVEKVRVTQSWNGQRARSQAERQKTKYPPELPEKRRIPADQFDDIDHQELRDSLTELGNFVYAKAEIRKRATND